MIMHKCLSLWGECEREIVISHMEHHHHEARENLLVKNEKKLDSLPLIQVKFVHVHNTL